MSESGAKTVIKDTEGRKWEIAINYGTLGAIKKHLGVDLLLELLPEEPGKTDFQGPVDSLPLISRLQVDDLLFVNVLYCLVLRQADQLGVDDDDFGSHLTPEIVDDAKKIFWRELEDFFRNAGQSKQPQVLAIQELRHAMAQFRALEGELMSQLKTKIPQVRQEMKKALTVCRADFERELKQTSGSSGGKLLDD